MPVWNPWHGCHKISQGCKNCYVFREDSAFDTAIPTNVIRKTSSFDLPVRKDRRHNWKYPSNTEFALCFTSDFLIEEADEWRSNIWHIIKSRKDCRFFFFTKRIHRLKECLPEDWDNGYENVAIGCTVENQAMANYRLPIFLSLPIRHRLIIVAPMLEQIEISAFLNPDIIEEVSVGGESGKYARPLVYDWVLHLRQQCMEAEVAFTFHQTGSYLIKDGRRYYIPRPLQHEQAKKADLDFTHF